MMVRYWRCCCLGLRLVVLQPAAAVRACLSPPPTIRRLTAHHHAWSLKNGAGGAAAAAASSLFMISGSLFSGFCSASFTSSNAVFPDSFLFRCVGSRTEEGAVARRRQRLTT